MRGEKLRFSKKTLEKLTPRFSERCLPDENTPDDNTPGYYRLIPEEF